MWVIINKTYAGLLCGQNFFVSGGEKRDLFIDQIAELCKKLGKENVIDSCAPWDEHKDHKAVAAAELRIKAKAAIASVEQMQARMFSLREIAKEINILKKEIDNAVPKAEQLANQSGIKWQAKTKREDAGNSRG
jgi:hypothetical protein